SRLLPQHLSSSSIGFWDAFVCASPQDSHFECEIWDLSVWDFFGIWDLGFGISPMSLRLQILQVARLAPRLLADSTELVRDFFRRQLSPSGAGIDRAGQPDLYYTIFTLAGFQALDVPIPLDTVEQFLRTYGDGEGLDFVH